MRMNSNCFTLPSIVEPNIVTLSTPGRSRNYSKRINTISSLPLSSPKPIQHEPDLKLMLLPKSKIEMIDSSVLHTWYLQVADAAFGGNAISI